MSTYCLKALMATIVVTGALTLAGCSVPSPEPSPQTNTVAPVPSTPTGVYEGVLPAADCPGIRTALYLRANGTYTRTSEYLERNFSIEEAGSWSKQSETLIRLVPLEKNSRPYTLKVTEGSVCFVNDDGSDYGSELAKYYVLKKN